MIKNAENVGQRGRFLWRDPTTIFGGHRSSHSHDEGISKEEVREAQAMDFDQRDPRISRVSSRPTAAGRRWIINERKATKPNGELFNAYLEKARS